MRMDSILEAIGRTPLVRLRRMNPGPAEVWAKIEGMNPGGSAKDRPALSMVEAAEKDGRLKPGGTIVEATGGNTGVGLALVAAAKGYRCILVCPRGTSAEKIAIMEAFGADVRQTDPLADAESPDGYIGTARRIGAEAGNFLTDQFNNAANPAAHIATTAEEILQDLDGRLDAFVACVGSGGTITGVGHALKAKLPALRLIRVSPRGNAHGVAGQPTAIEGVSSFDPEERFEGCPPIDEIAEVADALAFETASRLAREEALLVGPSSGAAVAIALRLAAKLPSSSRIVALCPDTGRNYLSKPIGL